MSHIDYLLERREVHCDVYSYQFPMERYVDITNNFPDGLYPYVRVVSLYDEYPFEHEFFLQISQSFPFMQKLSLMNYRGQNHKQSCQSMHNNQNLSIVKYSHLTELRIEEVHDDYIEEFLCHKKTFFCNYILLGIDYKSLERVTHNFTRDSTRINCSKVNELTSPRTKSCSIKSSQDYFPCAEID